MALPRAALVLFLLGFAVHAARSYECDAKAVRLKNGKCQCVSNDCDNSPNLRFEPGTVCATCTTSSAFIPPTNYCGKELWGWQMYAGADCLGEENWEPYFPLAHADECRKNCDQRGNCSMFLWIVDDLSKECGPDLFTGRCRLPKPGAVCKNPWQNGPALPRDLRFFYNVDGETNAIILENYKWPNGYFASERCQITRLNGSEVDHSTVDRYTHSVEDCAETCNNNSACLNFVWKFARNEPLRRLRQDYSIRHPSGCVVNVDVRCSNLHSKADKKLLDGRVSYVSYSHANARNGYERPIPYKGCTDGKLIGGEGNEAIIQLADAYQCSAFCRDTQDCNSFIWREPSGKGLPGRCVLSEATFEDCQSDEGKRSDLLYENMSIYFKSRQDRENALIENFG